MDDQDACLDLGMLCRCCDHSYSLPEIDGLTDSQRETIEELCRLCVDNFRRTAVNS